jgi:hypothetical protein
LSPAGPGPVVEDGVPLPNYHLRFVNRLPASLADLRTDASADGFTSRLVVQSGSFNVNSPSPEAWTALLRSVRPAGLDTWTVADLDELTGTQRVGAGATGPTFAEDFADSSQDNGEPPGAAFLRLSQSAQEVFEVIDIPSTPPTLPNSAVDLNGINRARQRGVRGGDRETAKFAVRNLSAADLQDIAQRIALNIRGKFDASGPFRSMEEFLTLKGSNGQTVIEDAIEQAGVNDALGISATTLLQSDIMNALAPFLSVRSDTFRIRVYGESVNPATLRVDGRAFGEAIVQRVPDPVDLNDDIIKPAGPFGRQFRIISFRWLDPSEI